MHRVRSTEKLIGRYFFSQHHTNTPTSHIPLVLHSLPFSALLTHLALHTLNSLALLRPLALLKHNQNV